MKARPPSDYAAATGLSMSGASKDLRQLVGDSDSGIIAWENDKCTFTHLSSLFSR